MIFGKLVKKQNMTVTTAGTKKCAHITDFNCNFKFLVLFFIFNFYFKFQGKCLIKNKTNSIFFYCKPKTALLVKQSHSLVNVKMDMAVGTPRSHN